MCCFCFGLCSALVLLTPTSWQVFTFCSCFSPPALFSVLLLLLLSHSRSLSPMCACVCVPACVCSFQSRRHCTLPTLCKNGASVCSLVCFQRCELNSCGCFTHRVMSDERGGKLKETEDVFLLNTYRNKCEPLTLSQPAAKSFMKKQPCGGCKAPNLQAHMHK